MEYNFRETEAKWKKYWEENKTYKVELDRSKPKYYVLDMLPYTSGSGLHVGHPLGYIASDIFSRYKRLKGFNVLHPMGFDAFGLPAEQYAIETGQHPEVTTRTNIAQYKSQLLSIGFSYDWDREFSTCDPGYYKWTQWIFLKLYNHWYNAETDKAEPIEQLVETFEQEGNFRVNANSSCEVLFSKDDWVGYTDARKEEILLDYRLAYLAWSEVNWCPALGTVLANDEVKDGVSERGGHPIEKMKMRQWFLRITAYAQQLLDGLETIDWSDSLKEMQRNWIGRSEGASVHFQIEGSKEQMEVFTTRPDTIFGATFMVIAPEHELVDQITSEEQKGKIDSYISHVQSRTDVERQQEKIVSGEFTGSYAINPFTNQPIPIWIAEYVLIGYGTGAIMAVPSDDLRDRAFAEKFELPIIDVIDRSDYPNAQAEDKVGKLINSGLLNGLEINEAISKIIYEIESKGLGKKKINYRLRDAGFSRQRYWGEPFPIVYKDEVPYQLKESDLPLELPSVESFKPTGDGKSPIAQNTEWVNRPDGTTRETDTMPGYAATCWYFLRYCDPENEEAFIDPEIEKYWGNVDLYAGGSEHAVGHLMYSRFTHRFLNDIGLVTTEEPFQKLINQGMIQGRSSIVYRITGTNTFVSEGLKDEHKTTPLHVDVNMVNNDVLNTEQFKHWREDYKDAEFILEDGKYKCGYEFEKMSKRWYNVVNPDDMIEQYGADTFRMYEMFLGPIEQSKPWITNGIDGVFRFIKKLWRLFQDQDSNWLITDEQPTPSEWKILHKTIKKVGQDIERYSFNTAVSAFMVAVNELTDSKCHKEKILKELVVVLCPFAPHICEELWSKLGGEGSVCHASFPKVKEEYLVENTHTYPVSVNGKVRTKIDLPLDLTQEQAQEEVLAHEVIQKWLEGKELRKFIFVKGRIINVVV